MSQLYAWDGSLARAKCWDGRAVRYGRREAEVELIVDASAPLVRYLRQLHLSAALRSRTNEDGRTHDDEVVLELASCDRGLSELGSSELGERVDGKRRSHRGCCCYEAASESSSAGEEKI